MRYPPIALLSTFAQINPIWLFGPYDPGAISAASQPDWYVGFLEGSLRIMPNWETTAFGHTISWNVLIPALGPPGIIFTGAALFPWAERWVTGDHRYHHLNDRPRNAPFRTAIGMAAVTFYGLLWLAGGNDVFADKFHASLFATTWFFRFAVFLGPVVAFMVTKRICLGLQRRDAATMHHGVDGGFTESTNFLMSRNARYCSARRAQSQPRQSPTASQRPAPRARSVICATGSTASGPSTTSPSKSTVTSATSSPQAVGLDLTEERRPRGRPQRNHRPTRILGVPDQHRSTRRQPGDLDTLEVLVASAALPPAGHLDAVHRVPAVTTLPPSKHD